MKFKAAVVTEQGITFAVVPTKSHVLNSQTQRESFRNQMSTVFTGMPIILMSQNTKGTPTYHGRPDIVKFLARIHISRIPWREYTLS